jgi:hypothetical protein
VLGFDNQMFQYFPNWVGKAYSEELKTDGIDRILIKSPEVVK